MMTIENGRYTYIPEEENKDNEYVAFTMSDYDKNDSEFTYYDSIEKLFYILLSKQKWGTFCSDDFS